jgi:DNA-binding CsgD family transcriptional regulator
MGDIEGRTWIEPLAAREIQILGLISGGLSNRAIAQKLSLSLDTIKWYNKRIYRKLGVSNRAQASKVAAAQGLLEQKTPAEQREESDPPGNLPAQLTSFVGREKEIAQIRDLLQSKRLVVLTGAGGSGKTRLALQVAAELAENYRDGVWLVELASLKDPKLVPETIAQVLKVSMGASKSPTETLISFLRSKHLLLLLDNFEHLLEAAPFVGEFLSAAPQLSVLATSRERLHIYGEQEFSVHPLQLPEVQHTEPLEKLLSYEAVKLFTQRARSARPELDVNEATLPAHSWTACPWQSSWPLRRRRSTHFTYWQSSWKRTWMSCWTGRVICRLASAPCVRPSNGAKSCSNRKKGPCLLAWRSSAGEQTWRRSSKSAVLALKGN